VRTFWGENLLTSVVEFEANATIPSHSHPHEQITYLLEGDLEANIAGEIRQMQAGDLMVIPGGVEHFVKVGPKAARALDVFNPVREDLKY